MIYKISTADFQKQSGDFDLIRIVGDYVYLNSDKSLKKPFVSVSDSELPIECAEALNERENAIIDIRNAKLKELDECRSVANSQSVEYKGKKIQATENDQTLIIQAITIYTALGGTPKGYQWICEDNSRLDVDLNDLIAIAALIGKQVNENYNKCRTLKDKVIQATKIEQINKIVW